MRLSNGMKEYREPPETVEEARREFFNEMALLLIFLGIVFVLFILSFILNRPGVSLGLITGFVVISLVVYLDYRKRMKETKDRLERLENIQKRIEENQRMMERVHRRQLEEGLVPTPTITPAEWEQIVGRGFLRQRPKWFFIMNDQIITLVQNQVQAVTPDHLIKPRNPDYIKPR